MRVMLKTGFGLGMALFAAPLAQADGGAQSSALEGYVSVGVGALPEYEGSKAYMAAPYLEGELAKGQYFVRFEGGELQLNVSPSDRFHAGPLVGYRLGRGDVDNPYVSHLPHIEYAITAGGFVEYQHFAKDPRSGERVTLDAAEGAFNQQSGLLVTLRASVNRPVDFVDPGLIAGFEADASWADGDYMGTYFNVSSADSAASHLPTYRAKSGLETVGAAFTLDQFLSPKWSVGVRLHYARLEDAAAASPITARAGSPNQFFAGLVVGYVL